MKKYKTIIISSLLLIGALGFTYSYLGLIFLVSDYEFYRYYWMGILVYLPIYIVQPGLFALLAWINWKDIQATSGSVRGAVSTTFFAVGTVFFLTFFLLIFDPFLGIAGMSRLVE